MKTKQKFIFSFIAMGVIALTLTSFSESKMKRSNIWEENVKISVGGVTLNGFVAYDKNISGKRPAIVVVPEWWGLNDYAKYRARKLAELGYVAMAVDMFGNGRIANTPKEAQELTAPFYKDPTQAKYRMDAAIDRIKEIPVADPNNVAAIGYCFGGFVALNSAKLGSNLKGVVSFHGDLGGVRPDTKLMKAKLLVCQGGDDKFVTQHDVDLFKHQMDSAHINYTFKVYPNATHSFTNPNATEIGKQFNLPIEYNAEADKNSWNDMKVFFSTLFSH